MMSVSAKPSVCQLSWRAWEKDTENYLEEMPWPLEKAHLCRNNFNFFLKMNNISAEPGAFQLSWRAWQKMQGIIWKRCLAHCIHQFQFGDCRHISNLNASFQTE